MLLAQTDLLLDDPFAFFVLITCVSLSLLVGITFHEASHAFIARKLGDPTSDRLGMAKDYMAAKPMVLYESEDFVALASEEVAIRSIFPHEIDTFDPYEGEVRVWQS